jgi:PleD family two-component response regulator
MSSTVAQCRPFEIHRSGPAIAKPSKVMPPIEGKESNALPRVLLVDDHEPMLMRAAGVLKASCTIVGTAMNGRAGIDAATTLQPDVIVLAAALAAGAVLPRP